MSALKRQWKIHLIHHTHLDIGYTHTQDEVLKLQYKHLETAMDLIDHSADKSEKARFSWSPEITWALESWVKQASEKNLSRFIKMVQEGSIGLDGLYGNLLTGLCRPDEIMASFSVKEDLEKLTGTTINSAMITDVPGWNWGFVYALANNGIKYLSAGTNLSDRIGHILRAWADKPFYWVSSDGKGKVLTWVHGKGYSWFHTGLKKNNNLSKKLTPKRINAYLAALEKNDYPYNTLIIRYNIGQDNGPPDSNLSDIIENWNKTQPQMQITLSTNAQAMADFEKDYGHLLPEYSGDITPYWEDGAASTARETAIARDGSERLEQVSALNLMHAQNIDTVQLNDAYKDILLYNEHTWGAHNSISKPDHHFAKSQWEWKKNYAINGSKKSYDLLSKTIDGKLITPAPYSDKTALSEQPKAHDKLALCNTHDWAISQVIIVPTACNAILNNDGILIPSQRLSNDRLAFNALDIPPKSRVEYTLTNETPMNLPPAASRSPLELANANLKVKLNEADGTISNLIYKGKEFLKENDVEKFNQYIFASGKWGTKRHLHKPSTLKIDLVEDGPILTSICITSDAYKTNCLKTEITLNNLNQRLYISNLLDRPESRKKEGIYFEFPFELPDGRVQYDTLFGSATVDVDQLDGSNKNFITATRWVDLSNEDHGVSCALLDAPIFKSGPLVHDPFRSGPPDLCGWKRKTTYNGTFYSYVMNNYWMTNYKADQPGTTLFRYVFMPHGPFDAQMTQRFALEEAQPLIVVTLEDY